MICRKCGFHNKEGSLFCNKCGTSFSEESQKPASHEYDNDEFSKPNSKAKNRKDHGLKLLIIINIVLVVCVIMAYSYLFSRNQHENTTYSNSNTTYGNSYQQATPTINVVGVTLENYRKIREGMSLTEVEEILGPGKLVSSENKFDDYVWGSISAGRYISISIDRTNNTVFAFSEKGLE